jgi:hypothetical protein
MPTVLKTAAASLLIVCLSAAPFAVAQNGNANDQASDATSKHSVPEIRTVAAGAVGILVVGGIALLTTRRRGQAKT